jgi:hypothetical protein
MNQYRGYQFYPLPLDPQYAHEYDKHLFFTYSPDALYYP